MVIKKSQLIQLINDCLKNWKKSDPFITLGNYYFDATNYSLSYLCYVYAFQLGYTDIYKKIFELESLKNSSIYFPKNTNNHSSVLVSVIMPTQNRHNIIKESITSVLTQSLTNIELIVINDGGSDELSDIIKEINDPRLRYIKLEHSHGVSGARNKGINIAHGKYIAYLDDDDIFYPNHLSILVNNLEKTNSDLTYSKCYRAYGDYINSNFIINNKKIPWQPEFFNFPILLKGNYISTLNVLHKKECILNIGGFNESIRFCEDWDLWIRIACNYKVSSTVQITGEYRFRVESGSIKNTTMKHQNLMQFHDQLLNEFYSSLFYYIELYEYFRINKKHTECLYYQKKILDLFDSGFYPFNNEQLLEVGCMLLNISSAMPLKQRIIRLKKLCVLIILLKSSTLHHKLNSLYQKHLGWRFKSKIHHSND